MAKQDILAGATSVSLPIFVQDTGHTDGRGLAGLAWNSASLTGYYWRQGASSATAITLATSTLGTWTSGAFKEVDATHMPGVYEVGIPNAAIAASAKWVTIYYFGAAGMPPITLELQLVAYDPNDSTRLGLTALPNGSMTVKKNAGRTNFTFPMFSSSTRQMQTGLTVTCNVSRDGGSFAASSNAVSEIGASGMYKVDFTTTETNCDVMALKFTASGADDLPLTILTQP